jgi:hypothetical protein
MATSQLPLNKFRVITKTLASGSTTIYQENQDLATILLSAAITNVTGSTQSVTVQIQKSGSVQVSSLLYNAFIPMGEALNPFPGKVILERNDALIMKTAVSGSLEVVLSVLENANN